MLKADNDSLKRCIKEKRWNDLLEGHGLNPGIVVRDSLLTMFPQLFEEKGLRTNPDKTVTEQNFIDRSKWSLADVIEKIKDNRRSLNLKI